MKFEIYFEFGQKIKKIEADKGDPRVSDSTVRVEAFPPENSTTARSRRQPRAPSCSPLPSASIEVRFPSSTALRVPRHREWRRDGAARRYASELGPQRPSRGSRQARVKQEEAIGERIVARGGLESSGHVASELENSRRSEQCGLTGARLGKRSGRRGSEGPGEALCTLAGSERDSEGGGGRRAMAELH